VVAPSAGGVVLVPFPFSELSQAKLRPGRGARRCRPGRLDPVPSNEQPYGDLRAVHLTPSSFGCGSLRAESYARPGKLFTASRDLVVPDIPVLNADARHHVVDAVVVILRAGDRR
jgi:mRNA interferase MazF